jgi:nucleotidyltransferase substrate binding protein (TIGR01987 family)
MNRTDAVLRDLESVVSKLEAALNAPKSDLTRDSAILRFELAFEVSWKAIQKFALAEGFEVNSPRQAFERAFQLGWISDEVLWKQVLLQRNAAIHIYREPLAEALYGQLRSFLGGFKELLKHLKDKQSAQGDG